MHLNEDILHLALRCIDCGHVNELTHDHGVDGETVSCAQCRSRLGRVLAERMPTRH